MWKMLWMSMNFEGAPSREKEERSGLLAAAIVLPISATPALRLEHEIAPGKGAARLFCHPTPYPG